MANKMESIYITIYKLDFFNNITKVGRIVIYEFTTPFTDWVTTASQYLESAGVGVRAA
jgi:hypothetical protein